MMRGELLKIKIEYTSHVFYKDFIKKSKFIYRIDWKNQILYVLMLLISVFSLGMVLLDFLKPDGYELIFLLPLSYIVLMIFCQNSWNEIPQNIKYRSDISNCIRIYSVSDYTIGACI